MLRWPIAGLSQRAAGSIIYSMYSDKHILNAVYFPSSYASWWNAIGEMLLGQHIQLIKGILVSQKKKKSLVIKKHLLQSVL